MSRYFATIRVELITNDEEEAKEMANKIQIKHEDGVYAEKPYICYVTRQDGFDKKVLINNMD